MSISRIIDITQIFFYQGSNFVYDSAPLFEIFRGDARRCAFARAKALSYFFALAKIPTYFQHYKYVIIIADASVIDHGNVISRFRNGSIEDI